MSTTSITQFSEFEVKDSYVKFKDEDTAEKLGCVGKLGETLNAKTITKKCEGVVVKSVTKGDGTGELAFTLHMTLSAFRKMFGLDSEGLKDGVYAYGQNSRHKEFCYTCKVLDEDGNIKYKAYPKCCVTSGISNAIENGVEEVAEIEVTAAIMPDEKGNGMYEALEDEFASATDEAWLKGFNINLVATSTT